MTSGNTLVVVDACDIWEGTRCPPLGTGNHGVWAGVGDGPAYGRSQAGAAGGSSSCQPCGSPLHRPPAPQPLLGGFSGSGRPKATPAVHSFLMSQQQPGASGRRGHLLSDAP